MYHNKFKIGTGPIPAVSGSKLTGQPLPHRTSLVAISTLTSEINFYTRLMQLVDPQTEQPLFTIRQIELACAKCKEEGKSHECVHLLHLVPEWQSGERHRKLKVMASNIVVLQVYYDLKHADDFVV